MDIILQVRGVVVCDKMGNCVWMFVFIREVCITYILIIRHLKLMVKIGFKLSLLKFVHPFKLALY